MEYTDFTNGENRLIQQNTDIRNEKW